MCPFSLECLLCSSPVGALGTQPLNVPQKFIFQWGEVTLGKCCNEIKLDSEVAAIFLEKRMVQEAEIQWKGCSNVRGWEESILDRGWWWSEMTCPRVIQAQPSCRKDEGKEMSLEKPAEGNYAGLDAGIVSSTLWDNSFNE